MWKKGSSFVMVSEQAAPVTLCLPATNRKLG